MSERPRGVAIVAIWHIAWGLFLGLLLLVVRLQPDGFESFGRSFASFGLSGRWFLISTILIAALTLLSGIGLWAGEQGGWWLGTFCSIYGVAVALQTMKLMAWFQSQHVIEAVRPDTMLNLAVRAALNLGVVLYLMRSEIMHHFEVPESRRLVSIGGSVIIVVLIWVASNTIGRT